MIRAAPQMHRSAYLCGAKVFKQACSSQRSTALAKVESKPIMEHWEYEFEWLRVQHLVKDLLGRDALPDLNAMLFLIGIQELGRWKKSFTKEEKQDLMHIAVCRLLEPGGFYRFVGRDADGWPHYERAERQPEGGLAEQELLLKKEVIAYFKVWEAEQQALGLTATPPQPQ